MGFVRYAIQSIIFTLMKGLSPKHLFLHYLKHSKNTIYRLLLIILSATQQNLFFVTYAKLLPESMGGSVAQQCFSSDSLTSLQCFYT